ncbi:MAG TPA: hypothetical protein VK553_08695, partial [Candidatus Nitrosopolaris rasttigaisensis]|nr:hypothetical protein [Candidatus Nitrosopolaris rasttigaisensis]
IKEAIINNTDAKTRLVLLFFIVASNNEKVYLLYFLHVYQMYLDDIVLYNLKAIMHLSGKPVRHVSHT